MADFAIAYKLTNLNEGGYTVTDGDTGEETFDGISRRYHPNWPGWKIIDEIKSAGKNVIRNINFDERLKVLKRSFYLNEFWNPLRLSELDNQELANEIYDSAVNIGIPNAVKMAYRIAQLVEQTAVSDTLINTLNHAA